jgi:DeoR/GlpR family transcriptional regulator of sugar metabolism
MELAKNGANTVNLIGGAVNPVNMCVSGADSLARLKDLNIDLAFVASSAFAPEDGFSCGNADERRLKRFVVEKAKRTVVLMDQTKLGRSMPYTFARPDEVDILILDAAPTAALLEISAKTGMKIF